MVIEFFGKSGCGKTTLVNALCDRSLYIIAPPKRSIDTIVFFLVRPYLWGLMYQLIKIGQQHNRIGRKRKDFLYLTKLFYTYLSFGKSSDVCVLLDQGLMQFLLSIYYFDSYNSEVERLVRLIKKQFEINLVVCNCDNTTLVQRISNRMEDANSRARRAERFVDFEEDDILELHDRFINSVVSLIGNRITVDTAGCFSTAIANVRSFAQKLLERGGEK